MNIVKRIVTFKPSFPARLITGLIAVTAITAVCMVTGVVDLTQGLAHRDAVYAGRAIEEGARAYMDQCARCHGTGGKGIEGQGPALSSRNFFENRIKEVGWVGTIEAYISAVTRSGIPLKSSPVWEVVHPPFSDQFGGPLRDDQIENVTRFIMNWKQQPVDDAEAVNPPAPGAAFAPLPTPVPLTPEQEEGKNIFLKNGCNACHAIKGVATGAIGPSLTNVYEEGVKWIASAEYKASQGKAATPEDYIRESVAIPAAFLVPECPQGACPAGVMPPNYGETIPATDLDKLISYLSTLGRPAE
jgi:mono/diheme cytochrome c family protein